jgi:hypothetical protein
MVNLNYNNYFPGGVCMHFSWKTILFLCLGTVLIGQTALGNIIPIDQGGLEGVVSDSITQVPIPEVRVELFASSPDWRIVIISPVAETLTDQNGFYKFENLPALYYLARYSKDGYENVLEKIQIQPNLIINLNVPLVPAGAPTPTPTPQPKSLLHGRVVEYVGILAVVPEPVPDAHIMVFKSWMTPAGRTSIEPAPPLFCEAYTNEEGLYEIPEIPYGSYHILAEAEGYYAEKALIEIRESDVERNFELKKKLPPPPTPTPPPQAFGEVFGIVAGLNEDGETTHPLAGAVIEVFNALLDCGGETKCITPPVLRAVTDENGFYDIPGIPGGLWQMVARAEGYVPGVQDVDIIPDEKTEKNFILKYMSAPPPPPTGSVIKGRVFEKCVLTPPLKPIAGALVSLYPLLYQSQWKDPNAVASAVTDEFGQYQIPDIPPGSYVAVAEAAGFQRCMRNVFIPSGVSVCLNFGLRPDIEPEPTPVPGMGNIAGQVLSIATGGLLEPRPGASVVLFAIHCFKSEIIPGPIRQTITDEEGKFWIPDVPGGDYVLMAKAEGYAPETAPVRVITGETQEVILNLRPILEPTPTPSPFTGTLEGHVAFESGGDLIPIPSAQIFAIRLGNNTPDLLGDFPVNHTATNEYGYYKFVSLVEGRYLVLATAEGFYPSQAEGDVLPQQITTMDFVLKALDFPSTGTGILFGRVMTVDAPTTPGSPPNFIPLKDAEILALRVHRTLVDEETLIPAGKAVTDEKGEYLVENLPDGMYAVIAQKYGYSWGIKNARVRPMNATRLNFLLIPLGAAPPDPGKTIVFENTFDEADENWKPAGAPDSFLMPQNIHIQGALQLSCSDNLNTFGYWYSPSDAVPLNENVIYKASYAISSDITDLTKVPCIRIRFNSQSEQIADMMVINSRGDAAVCPGPAGRIYTLYFTLPSQEIHLPENENDIYVSFDMVNMDKDDAQNALVSLDWIKIEALSKALLPQGTEIASLDFTQGSHGWVNQFAEDVFSAPTPLSAPESGGLALKSVNNTRTYGVWISPLRFIPMQGNAIYAIRWSLFSDQLETSSVPGIRLRASDEQNRLITQKCIFSNAEGDNSPTAAGGEYTMYYAAPPELDGAGLTLAFDIVNFDKSDAPEGTIGARSVSVWAIPAEQMP